MYTVAVGVLRVNEDRDVDLVYLNRKHGIGHVAVRLGIRAAKFSREPILTKIKADRALAVDMNDDSLGDLITVENTPSGVKVHLHVGRGDGRFKRTAARTLSSDFVHYFHRAPPVAAGDTNGDGTTDVTVLGPDAVASLRVDAEGSFEDPVVTQLTYDPPDLAEGGVDHLVANLSGFAVADFDRDGAGEPIFGVIEHQYDEGGPLMMLDQNPDGTFAERVLDAPHGGDTGYAVGHLNGDARPDLVTTSVRSAVRGGGSAYLATPAADFEQFNLPTPSGPGPVISDFDGDGFNDVAVVGDLRADGVFLAGLGDGSFREPLTTNPDLVSGPLFRTPTGLVAGDFDRDGWPDLVRSQKRCASQGRTLCKSGLIVQRNVLGDGQKLRLKVRGLRLGADAERLLAKGGVLRGRCSGLCSITAKLLIDSKESPLPEGKALLRGEGDWGPHPSTLRLRARSKRARELLEDYSGPPLRTTLHVVVRSVDGGKPINRRIPIRHTIR